RRRAAVGRDRRPAVLLRGALAGGAATQLVRAPPGVDGRGVYRPHAARHRRRARALGDRLADAASRVRAGIRTSGADADPDAHRAARGAGAIPAARHTLARDVASGARRARAVADAAGPLGP